MTCIDGQPASHFRLYEFENGDGLAMVHASLLESLERVRRDLGAMLNQEVWILVTDAVRTPADLEQLAARLGWADQGGLVSRDSKHLVKYGGIAADIVAVVAGTKRRIAQRTLGVVARRHFDFVKDDYADGHVHVDNREQGLKP
jgi:hypothetical protein